MSDIADYEVGNKERAMIDEVIPGGTISEEVVSDRRGEQSGDGADRHCEGDQGRS